MMMMKFLVMGLLVVVMQSVLQARPAADAVDWLQWKTEQSHSYSTQLEEEYRRETWTRNYGYIQKHNAKNGGTKLKLNQFADMVYNL